MDTLNQFQSITFPNGIIIHMGLPFPGRRHDCFMLRETKILNQLEEHMADFCISGDQGYPLRPTPKVMYKKSSKYKAGKIQQLYGHL